MNKVERMARKICDEIDRKYRFLFLTLVAIICVISILMCIYVQFFYKNALLDPFMFGFGGNAQDQFAELKSNFSLLFQNDILGQYDYEGNIPNLKKSNKKIVYTAYDLVKSESGLYNVNAKIPEININKPKIDEINAEIKSIYYNKAHSIMRKADGNTTYNVSFEAFINENLLSVIVKSSLKEEEKNEKVSFKTYVYDFEKNKVVDLKDLISMKGLNTSEVQEKINAEIKRQYETSNALAEEFENVYKRNLDDEIYLIDNTENYFLTDDNKLYVFYAYGNNEYTNEMDILVF